MVVAVVEEKKEMEVEETRKKNARAERLKLRNRR